MNLNKLGENTFLPEITHISTHGIWLLTQQQEELFMPYESFPWFKDAPVGKILHVEELSPDHYHWPELDIDLTREIIAHPDKFPLTAQ